MIEIKMDRYDMCVNVKCSSEGYEVNASGFLSILEQFLTSLDSYDTVDIEIKRTSAVSETIRFDNMNTSGYPVGEEITITGVSEFEPKYAR